MVRTRSSVQVRLSALYKSHRQAVFEETACLFFCLKIPRSDCLATGHAPGGDMRTKSAAGTDLLPAPEAGVFLSVYQWKMFTATEHRRLRLLRIAEIRIYSTKYRETHITNYYIHPTIKQHPVPANSEIQGAVKLCSAVNGLCVAVLERLKQIAELIGSAPVRFFEGVNIAVCRFHL